MKRLCHSDAVYPNIHTHKTCILTHLIGLRSQHLIGSLTCSLSLSKYVCMYVCAPVHVVNANTNISHFAWYYIKFACHLMPQHYLHLSISNY